jgi:hypothetical protein
MDLATRDVGMAFADMICHDPQWLAAEFDELVSANFSEPPVPRPPAPPRVPPCHVPGTQLPRRRPTPAWRAPPSRPRGRDTAGSARLRRLSRPAAGLPPRAPDRRRPA